MGEVVRLLDAIRRLQAAGSLRAASDLMDRAERGDARTSRRTVEKARCALVSADRYAGKLAFRPQRITGLDDARDRARERLAAIERRHDAIDHAARRSCVLLEWSRRADPAKQLD